VNRLVTVEPNASAFSTCAVYKPLPRQENKGQVLEPDILHVGVDLSQYTRLVRHVVQSDLESSRYAGGGAQLFAGFC
jgi:hypothetical protein